ncbi:MAG: TonB-dependent receptor [Muribaculaceae bacterium]|nr:TonB-dependent receptor [Muribaculaceae bacterium]
MKIALIAAVMLTVSLKGNAADGAVERLDTMDLRLSEVVVTDRTRYQVVEPQRLSPETLQRLNSSSVADAVRHLGGVQIKDYGGVGGIKCVNIRGMGSQHVGVVYDGLTIDNAQNGQVDLGRLSLDNVDRIELYNGNRSSIFQTARDFSSGGTIYITTRRPKFSPDKDYNLRLRLRGGSFGLVSPDIVADYRLSTRLTLSASAGYTYANGKYKFRISRHAPDGSLLYDTTATRTGGHVSAVRADINLYGSTDRGTYSAKLYYYDSSRGIPGAIVNNVFGTRERQWDKSAMAQSSGQWTLNSRYMIRYSAKWAWDYTHFVRDDPRMTPIDNSYYQRQCYGSVTHLYRITRRWDVSLATDLGWNTMSSDMPRFARPRRITSLDALSTALTVGAVDMQASLLLNYIHDNYMGYTTLARANHDITRLTPSVFVAWRPISAIDWRVSAFGKRSFRMPTFNELYFTDVGNRALRPEMATQLNVGSDISARLECPAVHDASCSISGYYNRIDDKIVAYPAGQQFRWTMMNLGKVDVWGAELTAQASGAAGSVDYTMRATYTYEYAVDMTNPATSYYRNQIPYIPRHSFSVALMPSWRKWELNLAGVYTGVRWSSRENSDDNYLAPWLVVDASLSRVINIGNMEWKACLQVNNLTDRHYQVIRNYPMPGRSYIASLTLKI